MAETRARRPSSLEQLAGFELRTLATQFFLGMILNLYVTLPFPSPLTTAAILGLVVLGAHILVGTAALGLSLRMVTVAARRAGRRGLGLSTAAAVGNAIAYLAGISFTVGGQTDTASFVMTVGFYLAMMASALLLGGPLRSPRGFPADASGTEPSYNPIVEEVRP